MAEISNSDVYKRQLRMSAIEYALKGITTVEEVRRVAFEDEDE